MGVTGSDIILPNGGHSGSQQLPECQDGFGTLWEFLLLSGAVGKQGKCLNWEFKPGPTKPSRIWNGRT